MHSVDLWFLQLSSIHLSFFPPFIHLTNLFLNSFDLFTSAFASRTYLPSFTAMAYISSFIHLTHVSSSVCLTD